MIHSRDSHDELQVLWSNRWSRQELPWSSEMVIIAGSPSHGSWLGNGGDDHGDHGWYWVMLVMFGDVYVMVLCWLTMFDDGLMVINLKVSGNGDSDDTCSDHCGSGVMDFQWRLDDHTTWTPVMCDGPNMVIPRKRPSWVKWSDRFFWTQTWDVPCDRKHRILSKLPMAIADWWKSDDLKHLRSAFKCLIMIHLDA